MGGLGKAELSKDQSAAAFNPNSRLIRGEISEGGRGSRRLCQLDLRTNKACQLPLPPL